MASRARRGGLEILQAQLAKADAQLEELPPPLLAFAASPLMRYFGPSVTVRVGLLLSALVLGLAVVGTPTVLLAATNLSIRSFQSEMKDTRRSLSSFSAVPSSCIGV